MLVTPVSELPLINGEGSALWTRGVDKRLCASEVWTGKNIIRSSIHSRPQSPHRPQSTDVHRDLAAISEVFPFAVHNSDALPS